MICRINYSYKQYLFNEMYEILAQHTFDINDKCVINLFYKPIVENSIRILTENGYDVTEFFEMKVNTIIDVVEIKKKLNFDYNLFLQLRANRKQYCL